MLPASHFLREGLRRHENGDLPAARAHYEDALRISPAHPDGNFLLGLIDCSQERFADAERHFRAALPAKADLPDLHLNLGGALGKLNRPAEAADALRQALLLAPENALAWSNLCKALTDSQQLDEAVHAGRRAVTLNPLLPDSHNNLGAALLARNDRSAAIEVWENALSTLPREAQVHNSLGAAYFAEKDYDRAILCFNRALELKPDLADAWCNLGVALSQKGDPAAGLAACRKATQISPDNPPAWRRLALALLETRDWPAAAHAAQQSLELQPDDLASLLVLGYALRNSGQSTDALPHALRSLQKSPQEPQAHCLLGQIFEDLGHFPAARACHQHALTLRPDSPDGLGHLALAHHKDNDCLSAITCYERAITLKPDHALSHRNLSMALLALGDYHRGWEEYEWRWKCPDFTTTPRDFGVPQWNGEPLAGLRILLHAEQGFGDTIQFIRYLLPIAEQRPARILVEAQPALLPLLRAIPTPVPVTWLASGHDRPPTGPDHLDFHSPLMSLPRAHQTRLDTIPGHLVPYLQPPPETALRWKEKLRHLPPGRRIGLAWAGNPKHKSDLQRSCPYTALETLRHLPGATFISLQKTPPGETIGGTTSGSQNFPLHDFTPHLADFADTAALIAQLDLVISVDTSVAHLAAALGRPTWLLVAYASEWRWLMDRPDSPWYPTLQILRQPARADWPPLVAELRRRLETEASFPH